MQDEEEIESFYEKEVEKADKEFLEQIKSSKNKNETEKRYLESISRLRNEYEKKYEKYLMLQKKKKNKKIKEKREKNPQFKVKGISLEEPKKERIKRKYSLFKFRIGIKVRKIKRKITPYVLTIFWLRTKYATKRLFFFLKRMLSELFKKVAAKVVSSLKTLNEVIKNAYSKISKAISGSLKKVINKISRKKKEEDKKTEDQLLAEKILSGK